jgi:hypothetical protein
MYIDEIAEEIRSEVTSGLPDVDTTDLFRGYAVLLLAKGRSVTAEDVHNAWSAWSANHAPDHESLVPFTQLSREIAKADQPFVDAIHRVAAGRGLSGPPPTSADDAFMRTLMPNGYPTEDKDRERLFEQYKTMVASSESLIGRRQAVNTFFITIQGALVAGVGLLLRGGDHPQQKGTALCALAIAGAVIAYSWGTLLRSLQQLHAGKFKVIDALERFSPAAIYRAEWKALGEGKDPKIYRSFTSREIWIPWAFLIMYGATASVGLLFATGLVKL